MVNSAGHWQHPARHTIVSLMNLHGKGRLKTSLTRMFHLDELPPALPRLLLQRHGHVLAQLRVDLLAHLPRDLALDLVLDVRPVGQSASARPAPLLAKAGQARHGVKDRRTGAGASPGP